MVGSQRGSFFIFIFLSHDSLNVAGLMDFKTGRRIFTSTVVNWDQRLARCRIRAAERYGVHSTFYRCFKGSLSASSCLSD